jgi:hypothetical protein
MLKRMLFRTVLKRVQGERTSATKAAAVAAMAGAGAASVAYRVLRKQ